MMTPPARIRASCYPGGTASMSILSRLSRKIPKRRAIARLLKPCLKEAQRTF
jgi:hypothetical protein